MAFLVLFMANALVIRPIRGKFTYEGVMIRQPDSGGCSGRSQVAEVSAEDTTQYTLTC